MSFMKFFDRLEDKVREHLSHVPILYAIVGGTAIVLFWRGVWEYANMLETLGGWWSVVFSPMGSIVMSALILLATGLFVSFFIGDRIIISGLRHEKKVEDKTEAEVREEEAQLVKLEKTLAGLRQEVSSLSELVKQKGK